MTEKWHKFALTEIERSHRRMTQWEKEFIESVKPRINLELSLSEGQEKTLLRIHEKMTDMARGWR